MRHVETAGKSLLAFTGLTWSLLQNNLKSICELRSQRNASGNPLRFFDHDGAILVFYSYQFHNLLQTTMTSI